MTAFNMQRLAVIIISAMIVQVASRCDHSQPRGVDQCHFIVECHGDIRDVIVTDKTCHNSYNGLSNIKLTLKNPTDNLIDGINDTHKLFLDSVTSFKVSGGIPNNLNILEYMNALKDLNFAQNEIKHINGTPFFKMYSLEKIDLSHNELTNVDDLFVFSFIPESLKTLLLAYNKIKQLSGFAFAELSYLVELDLSNNLISDLQEEPFMNLSSLEILRLDQNRITHLNGAINNLHRLTQLYLSYNEIEDISETSLKIIDDLVVFDVSGNKLTEVGSFMFSRHWDHINRIKHHSGQVCKINISYNNVKVIPKAAVHDDSLFSIRNVSQFIRNICVSTELQLSNNDISHIDYNAFNSFAELTHLDLSCNELEVFYVNNKNLEFIKKLNLSSNLIKKIDAETFALMKDLESLDLSINNFDHIPEYLFANNKNLKYLNMAYNNLKSIQCNSLKMFHSQGGVLDLSNNGLYELNIQNGENLKVIKLILHSNSINDLQLIDLSRQFKLFDVDLSNNLIESLTATSLKLPYMIFTLDLSYNKINSIAPGSFKRLRYLRYLNLDDNQLLELVYGTFQGLSSLKTLDLSFNQIHYLDSKIMIDLKSIDKLYLRNNSMVSLDYTIWLGHKFDLTVVVDGNKFSCGWLGTALNDYNNGFSKMKLLAINPSTHNSSLEGIVCQADKSEFLHLPGQSEDRVLVLLQKILQAINKQTLYLNNSYPIKFHPSMQIASDENAILK